VTLGLLMAMVAVAWQGSMYMGIVVGASMFLAITMTTTLGVLIPLVFRAIHIDPAVASGPLVTMLNDIIGLAIYLSLAMVMLSRLA
jgi:magnesium transporter